MAGAWIRLREKMIVPESLSQFYMPKVELELSLPILAQHLNHINLSQV